MQSILPPSALPHHAVVRVDLSDHDPPPPCFPLGCCQESWWPVDYSNLVTVEPVRGRLGYVNCSVTPLQTRVCRIIPLKNGRRLDSSYLDTPDYIVLDRPTYSNRGIRMIFIRKTAFFECIRSRIFRRRIFRMHTSSSNQKKKNRDFRRFRIRLSNSCVFKMYSN